MKQIVLILGLLISTFVTATPEEETTKHIQEIENYAMTYWQLRGLHSVTIEYIGSEPTPEGGRVCYKLTHFAEERPYKGCLSIEYVSSITYWEE